MPDATSVRILDQRTPEERDRPFLSGMRRTWLLPLYDLFSRLAGVRALHQRAVQLAGIAPGQCLVTAKPWTSFGFKTAQESETMAHSSVTGPPGATSRLRTVRPDGTPVYRYEQRPGVPAVSVAHFDAEAGHAGLPPVHRHAHDFLVLVYVEEGTGSFAMDGAERRLRPGQVHAVSPGRVIDVSAVLELARCRLWSVAFTPDAVPALAAVSPLAWARHPLLAMFAPGAGHGLVAETERARWSAWLRELAEELADPGRLGAREVVAGLLTRILVAAARLAPSAPLGAPDPLVERVFDEIEATFREPISVGDVARSLGYSSGHLTTVVRERTGRPLLEWITERRMTEVRRMLRETDLPLGVVAARTGLRDATYLVRRFRDRNGITPQQWRRGQRTPP